jgi:hypothetical protein
MGGFGGGPLVVGVRWSFADKDAGSSNSSAIRATEDAAQRASSVRRRLRLLSAKPSKLRRQDSNLRDAINSRASDRSTTPERKRKERESNPQRPKPHPFSRRDTAPMAALPEVAPAGLEPATRRLRVGSSAELSYGAMRCGRQESNLRRVAFQATALPTLSYGHA